MSRRVEAQQSPCLDANTRRSVKTIYLNIDSLLIDQWVYTGKCTRVVLAKKNTKAKPILILVTPEQQILDTIAASAHLSGLKWLGLGNDISVGFKPGITGKLIELHYFDLRSGTLQTIPSQTLTISNAALGLPDNQRILTSDAKASVASKTHFQLVAAFIHGPYIMWLIQKSQGLCKKNVPACTHHVDITYWLVKMPFDESINGVLDKAVEVVPIPFHSNMLAMRKDCRKWYHKDDVVEDLPLWAQFSSPVPVSYQSDIYFVSLPYLPAGYLNVKTGTWQPCNLPGVQHPEYCFFQHHEGQNNMVACIQTGRNYIPGLDNNYFNKKKLVATRILSGHFNFETGFGTPVFLDNDHLLQAIPLHFEGQTLYVKELPQVYQWSKWSGVMMTQQYGKLRKYRCE